LGTAPRGTLRITGPSWFASQRMADLLSEFRSRYPEIVVDISFEDRVVDLVEEGYDVALRVAPDSDSLGAGLIARPVRPISFVITASRRYVPLKLRAFIDFVLEYSSRVPQVKLPAAV